MGRLLIFKGEGESTFLFRQFCFFSNFFFSLFGYGGSQTVDTMNHGYCRCVVLKQSKLLDILVA